MNINFNIKYKQIGQQANLKFRCHKEEHSDEIDSVCYNQFCTEFRLNCFTCIKCGIHQNHFKNVEKISSLIEFIQNINKECDNLIDDLNRYIHRVNQSFALFKRGIRYKYSLLKERIVNLNMQQVNALLNSTTKLNEYKQSIKPIISQQTNKLTQQFHNYMNNYNYLHLIIRLIKIRQNCPNSYTNKV